VDVGLDKDAFTRCLSERRFAGAVETDFSEARKLGLRSTPTFLINGRALVGAYPIETFRSVIDELLGRK
jgi:predicted DsbA family dithiol-disulfide isomerase